MAQQSPSTDYPDTRESGSNQICEQTNTPTVKTVAMKPADEEHKYTNRISPYPEIPHCQECLPGYQHNLRGSDISGKEFAEETSGASGVVNGLHLLDDDDEEEDDDEIQDRFLNHDEDGDASRDCNKSGNSVCVHSTGVPVTIHLMHYFTGIAGILQAVVFIMIVYLTVFFPPAFGVIYCAKKYQMTLVDIFWDLTKLIAISDIAIRRLLSHGSRVLRHTRAIFSTSTPVNSAAAATSVAATTSSTGTSTNSAGLKSFMMLPGPKGWPIVGSFPEYFKKENQGQMHEMMRRRHREFGKIFREQFGPRHNVAIADPALVEEILRKEGKYPSRPPYESWVLYSSLRNRRGGLMTSENEYWRRSRSAFAAKLRPKAVCDYVEGINQVCADLVDRISYLKDETGGTHLVPRLLNELNKFTMETILYVMLNKRVGCLDREVSESVNTFIQSIATMFLTGHQLMVYAKIHKILRTRPWRNHVQSWDKIYEFATEHINQRIDEVAKELETGVPPLEGEHVDFMKYVVGTHQLSRNEIVDNIIEVFMGGIDTTANSLAFLFYLLSKHDSVQTRLVEEIDNVLGKRQASSSDLQKMPFLKACVKETLRLFPPIPMNARTTTEEMSVGGYHIPKNTIIMLNLYVMARDEEIFSQPDDFKPERWVTGEQEANVHPFSLIPFGFGSRSCVGRRIAETQIYLATIQILQRYWLKKSDKFDIKPSVRTQMTPGPELPVMFVER